MRKKQKFYVVWKGRQTGIFSSWEACETQVKGFPEAQYKAFESRASAERAYQGSYHDYEGKPGSIKQWLFAPEPPITESCAVDAACSGSPGWLEYRGVYTSTGKEIFREGPFPGGTNNVGEFLAIVHALVLFEKKDVRMPIYSDSETAIAWVRAKKCKTKLEPDTTNASLFELIGRAETWLAENTTVNTLLKWDTEAWGENPADFNRK